MIKSIAYFPSSCARNSSEPLSAFLESCHRNGIKTQENSLNADCAVIWSVLWNGRMSANHDVYLHYRQQNKPVIVLDIGALYRGHTWKIAVNNVNAQGYYGHTENLDFKRPSKLKMSLAIQMKRQNDILIATQHGRSLQAEALDSIESWIKKTVELLKQHTDRNIIVRSHPRFPIHPGALPEGVSLEKPQHIPGTYDSFNLRFDYHAVVNYNSGPGIQAAIEGCPILVDSTSLAHPVSISLDQIDAPMDVDREQWFVEITHTEYTIEEIKQGQWINRLAPALTL